MRAIPRIGEFVKFTNNKQGDYFSWKVTEITYRESGDIDIRTELLDNVDNRGYSFETEDEFDAYYQSYLHEGWQSKEGIVENMRVKTHNNEIKK